MTAALALPLRTSTAMRPLAPQVRPEVRETKVARLKRLAQEADDGKTVDTSNLPDEEFLKLLCRT